MASSSVSFEVYVVVSIIAVVIFWPLMFVLSKIFRGKRLQILGSLVASIFLAPIFYVLLITVAYTASIQYPSHTFTSEAWKSHGERVRHGDRVPPERYLFSQDLIKRKVLIGKTKDEVIELLGPGGETGDVLVYNLGFVPGHGVDPDVLEVYFENGIVVEVKQRRT